MMSGVEAEARLVIDDLRKGAAVGVGDPPDLLG
jgi:hypothetical protein